MDRGTRAGDLWHLHMDGCMKPAPESGWNALWADAKWIGRGLLVVMEYPRWDHDVDFREACMGGC